MALAGQLGRLAGQSAVYGLGSLAARVASVLLLPLYTRYLTPTDYGQVELVLALVLAVSVITKLGLINAFFRFFFDNDDLQRRREVFATVMWGLGGLATVASLLLILLAGPIAHLLFGNGVDHGASLVRIGALGVWISVLYELLTALFRVQQRPVAYSIATMVNLLATVGCTVVLVVYLDAGAEGLLLGNFLGTTVVFLYLAWSERAWLSRAFERKLLRPMLDFGLPMVPAGAALWGVNLIDRPILSSMEGAAALGIYAISYKIVQAVMLLVQAFQLSWPAFAHSIRDDDEARRTYAWVLTLYAGGMSWAVVALGLVAPWLVRLLTEPAFYDADEAVVPLAAGAACYGAYFVVGIGAARVKKTRMNWLIVLIAVGVEVAACYLLIPPFGIAGAGWASALAYATMILLKAIYAQRHFHVPYPWLRMARPVLVGAALLALGLSVTSEYGAGALLFRIALIAAFPLLVLATGFLSRSELRLVLSRTSGLRRPRPA